MELVKTIYPWTSHVMGFLMTSSDHCQSSYIINVSLNGDEDASLFGFYDLSEDRSDNQSNVAKANLSN